MTSAGTINSDSDPWRFLSELMSDVDEPKACRVPDTLSALIDSGCEFEQVGPQMYRLTQVGLSAWEDYLTNCISYAGHNKPEICVYRQTGSTQELAKGFGRRLGLAVTDHQTAGRGRLDRRWQSAPGSCVMMSLSWPMKRQSSHDFISMRVGLAIARVVEELLPDKSVHIKWPNDTLVEGRKIAGVLIEMMLNTFIIGVGLNVSPPPPDPKHPHQATSLAEQGSKHHRLLVLNRLVSRLLMDLQDPMSDRVPDHWRARAALGQTQTFEQAGQRITGEVLDLDPDHGLIVRRDTGEIVTLPAATTSVVK